MNDELTVGADAARHAVAEFPRESCGLVVQCRESGARRYVPCVNRARTPSAHFVISRDDWRAAEQEGEVVRVVHSHPGASVRPSSGDLASCEATQVEWEILRVDRCESTGEVAITETHRWRPNGWQAPLLGRDFHYGVLDCWSLARDWYREERGIDLPDFDHGPDDWWQDRESDFSPYEDEDNYARCGLERINALPSRVGDLVVMQVRSRAGKPNHIGILVDDQRCIMLHHLYGQLSTRVVYGGYWREVTRFILRLKA